MAGEVSREQATERLLGRAVRRTVVVGQVEVRNTSIECVTNDRQTRVRRSYRISASTGPLSFAVEEVVSK